MTFVLRIRERQPGANGAQGPYGQHRAVPRLPGRIRYSRDIENGCGAVQYLPARPDAGRSGLCRPVRAVTAATIAPAAFSFTVIWR